MMEILGEILNNLISILGEIKNTYIDSGVEPGLAFAQIYESTSLPKYIRFLKITSYILTPILSGLIIWVIRNFINLQKIQAAAVAAAEIYPVSAPGGALQARWEEILRHIESTNEAEWKFAVIEADKLVDELLKSSGYLGETMGERLMSIDKTQIVTLDDLWDAHKTRNRLVHDANYFLRYAEAKRAVKLYEETLKELGAL